MTYGLGMEAYLNENFFCLRTCIGGERWFYLKGVWMSLRDEICLRRIT